MISPFNFWSIKSIPAKKISCFFKSFATNFETLLSILVNSILIGFAPLLMLLKKEPFLGTLEIAPQTLPLIKNTRLSPLVILGKNF